MTARIRFLTVVMLAIVLFVVFCPASVNATSGKALPIPWLDDLVAELLASLVKVLQDLMKGIGILFWALLKLCGIVGLLGSDFSTLFGSVVVEAINAVVSGSIAAVIRGSAAVSLGLLGLSLLAKAFWSDLRVVAFQRIVLWGLVIQAYLLNAPGIYTELEAMRVDLAEEVAGAVSTGAVPGCSGSTVEIILCMTGTNPAEVQVPDLTALPDSIPPCRLVDRVQSGADFGVGWDDAEEQQPQVEQQGAQRNPMLERFDHRHGPSGFRLSSPGRENVVQDQASAQVRRGRTSLEASLSQQRLKAAQGGSRRACEQSGQQGQRQAHQVEEQPPQRAVWDDLVGDQNPAARRQQDLAGVQYITLLVGSELAKDQRGDDQVEGGSRQVVADQGSIQVFQSHAPS
jgi:hypothetical protein